MEPLLKVRPSGRQSPQDTVRPRTHHPPNQCDRSAGRSLLLRAGTGWGGPRGVAPRRVGPSAQTADAQNSAQTPWNAECAGPLSANGVQEVAGVTF